MKSQILTWSLIKTPDPVFTDLRHSTPMNVSRIRNKTLNTWHQTIFKLILAKETDNFMASNIFQIGSAAESGQNSVTSYMNRGNQQLPDQNQEAETSSKGGSVTVSTLKI